MSGQQRLKVLGDLEYSELPVDPDFDRLTRLAAGLFGAPTSLLVLVDADRERYLSRRGWDGAEGPLGLSAEAVVSGEPHLLVLDATGDPRLPEAQHGEVGFYAGAPLNVNGERLGVLCVIDRLPRSAVDPQQLAQLADLADVAGSLLELKHEARVRARTAAELIREEWRHALTLEAGKVGSYSWDIVSGEVTANDILRRMYGLDPVKRLMIDEFFAAIHPDDVPAVQAAIDSTFEEGVDYVAEFRVLSGRWLSARGRVYQRGANGRPLVMMGVNIDITEAKHAADHTRHLLRELNHRVKNTLAMTQSLARQTLKQSPDPQAFIDAFAGRLRTLSDAHALLADRDWSGIGLVELVDSQVGPYALKGDRRLTVSGNDVELPPDHALGLGIILHELASNAARHGALSTEHGSVKIIWTIENGEVHLEWTESGGPELQNVPGTGFGARLIQRSLDKILGSRVTLEFPPSGAHATISFPIAPD